MHIQSSSKIYLICYYQYWVPQIYTLFRNRKLRKKAMGGLQPQIRKFAVPLR